MIFAPSSTVLIIQLESSDGEVEGSFSLPVSSLNTGLSKIVQLGQIEKMSV
jgi:hypothetical protein